MRFSFWLLVAVLAVLTAGACRPREREATARPQRPRTTPRDQYLIEGEELRVATAQNLYDVVRIQRPAWLTRTVRGLRGNDATVVYLDERKIGPPNILRELSVEVAIRLRYLTPTEAQLRFGPSHGSLAAIVVEVAK